MKSVYFFGIFYLSFALGCIFAMPSEFDFQSTSAEKKESTKAVSKSSGNSLIEPKATPRREIVEEITNDWSEIDKNLKIKILETGEFHGDEVVAVRSGEKWLGLFEKDGGFFLEPAEISIESVHDPVTDEENQKTGKKVSVKNRVEPFFLIKNSNLKKGKVETLFRGNRWEEFPADSDTEASEFLTFIRKDFKKEFVQSGEKYVLRVIEAQTETGENLLALVLEGLGRRQILHTVREEYADTDLGLLQWAGDLDGDAKPDFYLSPNVHYNVRNRVLYLSSAADAPNELVKKIAYFWTTGC